MSLRLSNIINFEGLRTERREWKHFGKALFVAIYIPLIVLFAIVEIVAWKVGETTSPERAAQLQAKDPQLMWMGYRDVTHARFKLAQVDRLRPDILLMGTSRFSVFRSEMFSPYSCYNMSKVSLTLDTYTELLRHLPEGYTPKIIIFSLDFFQFNPTYSSYLADSRPEFNVPPWLDHVHALSDVFTELFKNPLFPFAPDRDPIKGHPIMGLNAYLQSCGILSDGAETHPIIKMQRMANNPVALRNIVPNEVPFFYGASMGHKEMAEFEEFVSLAHAKGIALVGISMPMFDPIMEKLEDNPGYGIIGDFKAHVADGYFDHQGVIFFDELHLPGYSEDYRYFMDVHPTEAVAAAVLLRIDEDPRIKALLPRLDVEAIKRKLEEDRQAPQHIYLYPDGN